MAYEFWDYMWFDEEANVMPTVPIQTVGVVQAVDVPNGTVTINTTQAVNRLDDLNRAINAQGQLIAQQQQAMGQLQINVGAGGGEVLDRAAYYSVSNKIILLEKPIIYLLNGGGSNGQ